MKRSTVLGLSRHDDTRDGATGQLAPSDIALPVTDLPKEIA